MKDMNFFAKLTGLVLTAAVLFFYQSVAVQRAEAIAENEAVIAEITSYNEEIRRENEALERMNEEIPEEEEPADMGPYFDGVYEGEGAGYGGPIRVSVTVTDGYIETIEVTEHSGEDPAYYMLAESLVEAMTQAQSAEVDAASGATFSSAGLKQAVASALEQAVR